MRITSLVASLLLFPCGARAAELKHPDWHPNGMLLVAEGNCDGGGDLYLADLETHSVTLLWDDSESAGYPRWFADGERLAYHRIDTGRKARIFVLRLDAGFAVAATRRLSDGPFDIEPAPSPDGQTVAFSHPGENGLDIALLDVASGSVTRRFATAAAENFPSWVPDGTAIVYHARDDEGTQVYARDVGSGRQTPLTAGPGPNLVADVSHDGRFLAYASERSGDREIYVRDLADGSERRLTARPGRDGYPKFSPDGSRLAYHAVLDADTTVVRVLAMETGATLEFSCASPGSGGTRAPD